ncbi:MAG: restriction endonuclease [Bdellovibrionaceae bacterium]|nr:restriction endonuclease [Pseudobdellovibrionaceae bacterium]
MHFWEKYLTIKTLNPILPVLVNVALYYLFSFLPRRGLYMLVHIGFLPVKWSLKIVGWFLRLILIRVVYRLLKFLVLRLYYKLFPRKLPEINLTVGQIDKMGSTSGKWFEEYIASLYRAMGHQAQTTTEMRANGTLPKAIMKQRGCGDQGVDVVVDVINKNQEKERIIVQCKHYSQNVGNSAIQEIVGAMKMYKGDLAVVVTNQYFTESAINLAKENNVVLIDRNRLPKLIDSAVKKKLKAVA